MRRADLERVIARKEEELEILRLALAVLFDDDGEPRPDPPPRKRKHGATLPGQRRSFTPAERARIVREASELGYGGTRATARKYGINENTLSAWKRENPPDDDDQEDESHAGRGSGETVLEG